MSRTRALVLAAAVAGIAVWLPAAGSGFVADDYTLLDTLDRTPTLGSAFTHTDLAGGSGHFYRPLWVLFNKALLELGGGRPVWLHLGNLALFALLVVEVALLARALLGDRAAVAAAFAFAVFFRHGESVAWISGNTDLLAVALILGALLAGLRGRVIAVGLLAAAAALTKEVGFVCVPLLALTLWAVRRRDLRVLAAGAATQAAVLAVRLAVVGGLGGYGDAPLTAKRAAGSLVSFAVAAFAPPQLTLAARPALLVVPVVLAGALAVLAVAAWRRDVHRRVLLLGLAWAVVGLLPVVNLPLDLNTANGERLMLLASAGLALAFAAAWTSLRARWQRPVALVAAAAAAAVCVGDALAWRDAGALTRRTLAQAARLTPPHGRLLLVTFPQDHGPAHVFVNSLDRALHRRRPDASLLAACVPVHDGDGGRVTVTGGTAVATRPDSFDYPVLSDPVASPSCRYAKLASDGLGTASRVRVSLAPLPPGTATAYYDGNAIR